MQPLNGSYGPNADLNLETEKDASSSFPARYTASNHLDSAGTNVSLTFYTNQFRRHTERVNTSISKVRVTECYNGVDASMLVHTKRR